MDKEERKEISNLALQDLYQAFNSSVNHLLILRDFWKDVLNFSEGKDFIYDFPSVEKYNKNLKK